MSDTVVRSSVVPVSEVLDLTQWERLSKMFSAPAKTFVDIRRGKYSWWLPLIVCALFSYLFFAVVAKNIGIEQIVDNQTRMNPRAMLLNQENSPAQADAIEKSSVAFTKIAFIINPLIGIVSAAVFSLVLFLTVNYLFGGKATYKSVFTVYFYASLPVIIKMVLGTAVILVGIAPEMFNIANFAPTNIGAFLDVVETNKVVYTLLSSLDFITIWTLVLLSIGLSIVAGVKRSLGYLIVFGWWSVSLLFSVAIVAIKS